MTIEELKILKLLVADHKQRKKDFAKNPLTKFWDWGLHKFFDDEAFLKHSILHYKNLPFLLWNIFFNPISTIVFTSMIITFTLLLLLFYNK